MAASGCAIADASTHAVLQAQDSLAAQRRALLQCPRATDTQFATREIRWSPSPAPQALLARALGHTHLCTLPRAASTRHACQELDG